MSHLKKGPVRVIAGKFKGYRGIYDSDVSDKKKKKAVVFLPGFDAYKLITHDKLVSVEVKNEL